MTYAPLARLPVRLRLTLWYTALLAVALLLFAASVYLLMSHSLLTNLDSTLRTRIDQLRPSLEVTHGRVHLPSAGEDVDAPYIPAALVGPAGRPLSGPLPSPFGVWLRQNRASLPQGFHAGTVGDLRFATASIVRRRRPVGYLVVWQSMRSVDSARRSLLLLLLGIGPGLLLLSGIGGMVLARRTLRPVAEITHTAERISGTDLHRRVPVGPARDELTELAATFNDMIERLESAVERERRFTGDASHELRSPLAVILAEASLALEEPLEHGDYRRALEIIQEQAAGMNEMIAALLLLARVETVEGYREIVSTAEIVERAIRQCAPAAEERGVEISARITPDCAVAVNVALLVRAVRNLLDNAVKASPSGSIVRLEAECHGALTVLRIEDQGPGIAHAELERIFEPFYQIEKARTPGDSHGLGLAICRRIISAHGGEVSVHSAPGHGATFCIALPSYAAPIS